MEPIYIASIASFLVGLFGYIIVRFWILPIGRYLKVKGRLASDMKILLSMVPVEQPQKNQDPQIQAHRVSVHRHCIDLVSVYQNDLPYWYRLYLESKKEHPPEAAEFSARLANTRNHEHVLRQANEIKRLLRITS
jgi:hypothetical protein